MSEPLEYEIRTETIRSGFDGQTCWVHSRPGVIPGGGSDGLPAVVVTMQKLLLSGSDVFYALNDLRTDDLGRTWSGPVEHPHLGRRVLADGVEACICDVQPGWHAATGRLLAIGHVACYRDNRIMPDPRPRQTSYSVYDADARAWTPWDTLEMPDPVKFFGCGAGCVQRVDLPDGTLLLPVYFRHDPKSPAHQHAATVLRCAFDGARLTYLEHGNEMTVEGGRGFVEPSLTRYQGEYFLTLRNDERGYVTRGDGLRFATPRPWCFDDGTELGSYNTQQHWVTHSDGLFLVYTRRGANNDHVFRHRAPLFIAAVDPERLCVLRETERVLVPERGARLGNFGVCAVSPAETWVTVAEWMQPVGCERYGSDNSVYAARICWSRPNTLAPVA